MLLDKYPDKKRIKRYTTDTKGLTKEEEERNRRANILRSAIELIKNIRNIGIHGVEDTADEDPKSDEGYEVFMEVNKVLVKYMLNVEPLLAPNQNQPVGLFFSMYNVAFTWLRPSETYRCIGYL